MMNGIEQFYENAVIGQYVADIFDISYYSLLFSYAKSIVHK
jgi:hypothetical protein